MSEVTRILTRLEDGDSHASEELLPLVYDELRRLAQARMAAERPEHTLQATELVHEAYVRLVNGDAEVSWDSRGHFFAAAAEAMRRILIESARRKRTPKAGAGLNRVGLSSADLGQIESDDWVLDLNDALSRLELLKPDAAAIVKLRFFAGVTIAEAAAAMGISHSTADLHWAYARAWLQREMQTS